MDDNGSDMYSISKRFAGRRFLQISKQYDDAGSAGTWNSVMKVMLLSAKAEYKDIDPDNMPLFKQIRLMISNKASSIGNCQKKKKTG